MSAILSLFWVRNSLEVLLRAMPLSLENACLNMCAHTWTPTCSLKFQGTPKVRPEFQVSPVPDLGRIIAEGGCQALGSDHQTVSPSLLLRSWGPWAGYLVFLDPTSLIFRVRIIQLTS